MSTTRRPHMRIHLSSAPARARLSFRTFVDVELRHPGAARAIRQTYREHRTNGETRSASRSHTIAVYAVQWDHGRPMKRADLIARCLVQCINYGELMLDPNEADQLGDWLAANPHAAFALGPGRVVPVHQIPVRILAT